MSKQALYAVMVVVGLAAGTASATDDVGLHAACQLPSPLVTLGGALPHAAADLGEHHALKIVAFGSSSTYGTGASGPAATYPSRLAAELAELFPDAHLTVTNQGVPGETAGDMMQRLDRDVIAAAPDLVIWQTGTNDAMRDVPVEDFARLTVDGIGRLHTAGIDVVLMEPQYSPKLVQQPHYADYVDALRTIGHTTGAPVVRRFDMMKAWMASGQFVDATMLQSDDLHMRDASYACLGWVVAEGIADAINDAARPAAQMTGLQMTGRLTARAVPAR